MSAVAYAKSLGYEHIGLIGYSMGATTALLTGAESEDVRFVIADSPFAALRPYLEINLPVWSHLPAFPFTPLIMSIMPLLTGIDPDQVNALEAMKQMKQKPVLLVHTKDDPKVPLSDSEQIFQMADPNGNRIVGDGW